jgi:hypothetical protein
VTRDIRIDLNSTVHRGWPTLADLGLPLSTSWVYLDLSGYTDLGCTYNYNFHMVVLRKRGNYKVQHEDPSGMAFWRLQTWPICVRPGFLTQTNTDLQTSTDTVTFLQTAYRPPTDNLPPWTANPSRPLG